MSPASERETILIVEDDETNIDLLVDILGSDYEISIAMDGEAALRIASEIEPDLILLDIVMPKLDGYQVCERLKADLTTAEIPVIFMTSLTDEKNEVKGLNLGAIDYIRKPFKYHLVKARVKNHLALYRASRTILNQRDSIEEGYLRLKELEKYRDGLLSMIVHDMRNPLGVVLVNSELALEEAEGNVNQEILDSFLDVRSSAKKLNEIVDSILDINRLEEGVMSIEILPCDLPDIVEGVLADLHEVAEDRKIKYITPRNITTVLCDPNIIRRVIVNLVSFAIGNTDSDGCIDIEIAFSKKWVLFSISNDGPEIPAEYHERIFEKFFQVQAKEKGLNSDLMLAFCKLSVEAHGGSISVDRFAKAGTTFHMRIPVDSKDLEADTAWATTSSSNPPASESGERQPSVLLVDDCKAVTDSLGRYFSRKNWSVTAVNQPQKALRIARRMRPDLILLDIDMPEITGRELALQLEQFPELSRTNMAFLSGLIVPERVGPTGILQKETYPTIPKGLPLVEFGKIINRMMQVEKREETQ